MDKADHLLQAYRDRVVRPWRRDLSGAERVWIAVYPPDMERRLRLKIPEFGLATKDVGKEWAHVDLTTTFADWLAANEWRESYFAKPSAIQAALPGFASKVEESVRPLLDATGAEDTVVALSGVGALYPMMHVSWLVQRLAPNIKGRLLVFFPGSLEHGNYRLLDARDGWNYLAIPIVIPEGSSR